MTCFAPKVKTDAHGRFTLPELVVGQEYDISLERDNVVAHRRAIGAADTETAKVERAYGYSQRLTAGLHGDRSSRP